VTDSVVIEWLNSFYFSSVADSVVSSYWVVK